nr:type 1 glutamine amidotransferase [Desulfopila sp. IMCC35006]
MVAKRVETIVTAKQHNHQPQENYMRAHILQHVPFEEPGSIAPWLKSAHYQITATRFYRSASLPNPRDIDLLIALGGPMSVNDEERFPWLRIEKELIRQTIKAGKPVLGICLGAQLIASALGESVYPNRRKEIGWFPVQGLAHEDASIFSFPPSVDVFHWHGETFDLPDEAVLLARSEACENQAFQVGRRVIGLQFHLETTPETAQAIVTHCRQEILPSKFVQPEALILDQPPEKYQTINRLMTDILNFLTKK